METPVDKFIMAVPEDNYALCPCGCGKKWRFAVKEGIDSHYEEFIRKVESGETQ